jgi:hypothetical protein
MADSAPAAPAQSSAAQRKLTASERGILAAEVRLSFQYQRLLWEVLRDGVALGAEEVQDQRLLAAETPPEANPALDAFVFLLMWAVEGPLASTIVTGIQRMVVSALRRQMRLQRRAYMQLIDIEAGEAAELRRALEAATTRVARGERRAQVAQTQGGFSKRRRAEVAIARGDVALQELQRLETQSSAGLAMSARSGLRQTALALGGIRRADLPDYIVAVPNIALQQSIRFPQTPPSPGVSPGVTLRAQVDKHAFELIQESYLQQELYELIVHDENITAARAAAVLEDIGDQTPIDISALLDHYRLVTAALIWAQLLGAAGLRGRRMAEQDARARTAQRFAGDPVPPGSRQAVQLFTAPERHRAYLVARFGDAAEAWARTAPQDVLLGDVGFPAQPAPQVERYIQAGRGTAPGGLIGAIGQSLGLTVDPPTLRLDLVMQWLSMLAERTPETLLSRPAT